MKKLLFTMTFSVLLIFSSLTANARMAIFDDLWDVSQGTSVSASSGALAGGWWSDPRNMFGGAYGSNPDTKNNTIFKDYQPQGYVHWVNWQTSAPVTLQSFNLVAIHDYGLNTGEYRNINHRGISRFKLFSSTGLSGPWTLLYDYTVNPVLDSNWQPVYGGGADYSGLNYLELFADVPLTTAQYFRAEFTQYGTGSWVYGDAQGPRIYELDGYGPTVPIPATLFLLGPGLLGLLTLKKKFSR